MSRYICEIWASHTWRGETRDAWLPVDGMDYTTRDAAVDVAAEWEAEGYTARIKRKAA